MSAAHDDDAGTNSGAAYVFRFDGDRWVEEQKPVASDAAPHDFFGASVSVLCDAPGSCVAVVGAKDNDDDGAGSGSAYVFRSDPTNAGMQWLEVQKLTASDPAPGDLFGVSVAVTGDTGIVGAIGNPSVAYSARSS